MARRLSRGHKSQLGNRTKNHTRAGVYQVRGVSASTLR
jgi:hypothetical protein